MLVLEGLLASLAAQKRRHLLNAVIHRYLLSILKILTAERGWSLTTYFSEDVARLGHETQLVVIALLLLRPYHIVLDHELIYVLLLIGARPLVQLIQRSTMSRW